MPDTPYSDATLRQLEATVIGFSAPAAGGRMRAVARCRSSGHRVFMASCDLLDERQRLIAFAEGVHKRDPLRSEAP